MGKHTNAPPDDQQDQGLQDQEGKEGLAQGIPDQDNVGPCFELDDSWEEFVDLMMDDQEQEKTGKQDDQVDKEHQDQVVKNTMAPDQDGQQDLEYQDQEGETTTQTRKDAWVTFQLIKKPK